MGRPVIRTSGLTRRFGDLVAVDGVSMEIAEAEIFGFLGPNGSGKTTTIRMLCGLLDPTAGEVEVLGLRVPKDAATLRHRIGYMTQRFSLYEDLSCEENLEFIGRIYSLPRNERRRRIDEVVERYDLGKLRRQRAGTMSGGERQRLALAAATLHEPPLLFLDEPTSAVDPESRRQFWQSLFDLADGGTTILVSTHYMDEAERCHQLAILDDGKVAATGSPEALKGGIGVTVLQVEAADVRAARAALAGLEDLLSVAQLGARLRLLVSPDTADPEGRVSELLAAHGVAGQVRRAEPSLEDVFVVATR